MKVYKINWDKVENFEDLKTIVKVMTEHGEFTQQFRGFKEIEKYLEFDHELSI